MNFTKIVAILNEGKTVQFRPKGNSMTPRIKSGDLVTVEPINSAQEVEVGDIVLCKVKGRYLLHLISKSGQGFYEISNNHGHVNGWIPLSKIYGKVVDI